VQTKEEATEKKKDWKASETSHEVEKKDGKEQGSWQEREGCKEARKVPSPLPPESSLLLL
jgi:hypothetical protein